MYALGTAAYLTVVALSVSGIIPALSAYLVPAAASATVLEYLRMHRRGYSHATKGPSMGSISRVFLIYSFILLVSLGVSVPVLQ